MHSLFLTDLDGTLLQSDQTIGARTLEALELLGEREVVRVVATGRSLHSARCVLDREAPIDYLIFSSGTRLVDWGRVVPRNSCSRIRCLAPISSVPPAISSAKKWM